MPTSKLKHYFQQELLTREAMLYMLIMIRCFSGSLALVSLFLVFTSYITALIMIHGDFFVSYTFAQQVNKLNDSNKILCINNTIPAANMSRVNVSLPLQSVNSTSAPTNSMEEKKGSSSNSTSNVTIGSGQIVGTSKPVKPTLNPEPQNMEPERLVPNPQAFEEAKNEVNSPCPPENLRNSLANKNVIEPPLDPSKK